MPAIGMYQLADGQSSPVADAETAHLSPEGQALLVVTAFVDSVYNPLAEVGALLDVIRDGERDLFKGARAALASTARDKIIDIMQAVNCFHSLHKQVHEGSEAAKAGERVRGRQVPQVSQRWMEARRAGRPEL
jgi:hypothetical protein